ncbi:MAG: DNA cytosine methyltransferase [Cupriavidus sp.]|nr:MAG: DNA cytosine methyltransferase [Cupriavidus sp.]
MIRSQFRLDLHSELIVDNFAGGGGASTGIERALGRHVDIAVNHDREAVALHEANHPQTRHFCEDVFSIDPLEVTGGRPVGLAWFSPDCKHFSKAKGGKPLSKKIRGLAWVMVRWAATVAPRVMILENVEEFRTWGPLLADGSPCKKRSGQTFRSFVRQLERLGYVVEHRELRACDYGAPTIRKRLFLIARRDGCPIVWPQPTHGAPTSEGVRSGRLKPWRTAAECIDWSIPTRSIFERERPLAEATMRRIARGIQKFVIDAAEPFIVRTAYKGANGSYVNAATEPFRTITAQQDGLSVVSPFLTEHANASTQRTFAPAEPLRTQCSEVKGGHFAVAAAHLTRFNSEKSEDAAPRGQELEQPISTQDTQNRFAITSATLIGAGGPAYGGKPKPVDQPHGTLTTENHTAVVSACLAKHQSERNETDLNAVSVESPSPPLRRETATRL